MEKSYLIYLLVFVNYLTTDICFGDDLVLANTSLVDDVGHLRQSNLVLSITKGRELLSQNQIEQIYLNHKIQFDKTKTILGPAVDHGEIFIEVEVVSEEEFQSRKPLEESQAFTENGKVILSVNRLDTGLIRHEAVHAIIFNILEDRLPWWFEEGLAQILAGDPSDMKSSTLVVRHYVNARQRVVGLIEKCGFKSFSNYFDLLKRGNSESFSYNKVFNENCK